MQIIRQFEPIPTGTQPVYCAIGMFDGVHLGHQSVLKHVVQKAKSESGLAVVLTFKDHPADLLAPSRSPKLIYPSYYKQSLFESLGLDLAWMVPFNEQMSQFTAEDFIKRVESFCGNLSGICVGSNFSFGHKRQGNVALLQKLGQQSNFEVEAKPALSLEGDAVSSTRIRNLILSGQIDEASRLLGRRYSIIGKVIQGDGVGRQLGFRTANLDCERLALPPLGVYSISSTINGKSIPGVLNIGKRPTIHQSKPKVQVESHFWGAEFDLYGKQIELELKTKIRDEQKFPNLESLKSQIRQDIESAKKLFLSEE